MEQGWYGRPLSRLNAYLTAIAALGTAFVLYFLFSLLIVLTLFYVMPWVAFAGALGAVFLAVPVCILLHKILLLMLEVVKVVNGITRAVVHNLSIVKHGGAISDWRHVRDEGYDVSLWVYLALAIVSIEFTFFISGTWYIKELFNGYLVWGVLFLGGLWSYLWAEAIVWESRVAARKSQRQEWPDRGLLVLPESERGKIRHEWTLHQMRRWAPWLFGFAPLLAAYLAWAYVTQQEMQGWTLGTGGVLLFLFLLMVIDESLWKDNQQIP